MFSGPDEQFNSYRRIRLATRLSNKSYRNVIYAYMYAYLIRRVQIIIHSHLKKVCGKCTFRNLNDAHSLKLNTFFDRMNQNIYLT